MYQGLDLYSILQVHPVAEIEIIATAYKKLCKKYHPDINKNNEAPELMKQINLAYSILSDIEKRKQYDTYLAGQNLFTTGNNKVADRIRAADVLSGYLENIKNSSYMMAYKKLCKDDRIKVSLDDFIIWQNEVSKYCRITGFDIMSATELKNIRINSDRYEKAYKFTLFVEEHDIIDNKNYLNETFKYVVFSEKEWLVYLGYRNLNKEIEKMLTIERQRNYDNSNKGNNDFSNQDNSNNGNYSNEGVKKQRNADIKRNTSSKYKEIKKDSYSTSQGDAESFSERNNSYSCKTERKQFLDILGREIYRSTRYKRPLSIAVIELLLKTHSEDCITYEKHIDKIFNEIKAVIRKSDYAVIWSRQRIMLLLAETYYTGARKSVEKVKRNIINNNKNELLDCITAVLQVKNICSEEAIETAISCLIAEKHKIRK